MTNKDAPGPNPEELEKLIGEALAALARGLLALPVDGEKRLLLDQVVSSVDFEVGTEKLNTYYLKQGHSLGRGYKFWHLLHLPLKDWPHLPVSLQASEAFIDREGRVTCLAQRLAKGIVP